jgi:hypothetical protein
VPVANFALKTCARLHQKPLKTRTARSLGIAKEIDLETPNLLRAALGQSGGTVRGAAALPRPGRPYEPTASANDPYPHRVLGVRTAVGRFGLVSIRIQLFVTPFLTETGCVCPDRTESWCVPARDPHITAKERFIRRMWFTAAPNKRAANRTSMRGRC